MTHIALLHTGQVHVATFDKIFKDLNPHVTVTHDVAEHLLEQARASGLDAIRSETLERLAALSGADAVLCTCSTLGPLMAEAQGVLRVDDPLMEAACANGPNVLLALCLESTRAASMELLEATAERLGGALSPELILIDEAWPHFEAEDMATFGSMIADRVKARVAEGGVDCVVLGQASMRVAEPFLQDLDVPVLSSPGLAAEAAIKAALA